MPAPASTYAGAQRSGSSIIRWQSIGVSAALPSASTTGSPSVRFGTKWLSITSTCSQSAAGDRGGLGGEVGEVGREHARRDLDTHGGADPRTPAAGSAAAEQGQEHRVGAVPVRPQLHGPRHRARRVGHARAAAAAASSRRTSSRSASTAATHAGRLGEHRGAGHVGHHAPGPDAVERRAQQRTLERDELLEVAGLTAPARLRPPAQRTQPGARRVDQHPVERALAPGRTGAVGGHHAEQPGADPGRRRATSAARCSSRSEASSRAPRPPASAAEQRGLAAGPGAQVEPALVAPLERPRRPAPAPPAATPRPGRRPGPRRPRGSRPGRRTPAGPRTATSWTRCHRRRRAPRPWPGRAGRPG